MKTEKIRELSDEELKNQEREIAEQMFRFDSNWQRDRPKASTSFDR